MSNKIIAIDLGGTSAKMAIITQDGEIQDKWTIDTPIHDEGSHIVPGIIESIKKQLDLYNLTEDDFIGIGMGTPGAVDSESKTVIGAYNLNWKTRQDIGEAFEAAFDLPFFIDNDANVAALGEQWQGAGDQEPDVVMVTLGTGVGAGVVVDGKLVHGKNNAAGEFGHVTIETGPKAIACTCGKKGCLETLSSATGVMHLTRRHAREYEGDSDIKQKIDDGQALSSVDVFNAAKEGDTLAVKIVDEFAKSLGLGVSHLGNILNPARIVLGGGVANAGEFMREQVEAYFMEYTYPQINEKTKIVLATLGNDAGVLGAAQLVNLGVN